MSELIETNKGVGNEVNGNITTAEALLTSIVVHIGPEFMVVPMDGWKDVLRKLAEYDEAHKDDEDYESIVDSLNDLKIPMIPVSLVAREEESRIITPNSDIVRP